MCCKHNALHLCCYWSKLGQELLKKTHTHTHTGQQGTRPKTQEKELKNRSQVVSHLILISFNWHCIPVICNKEQSCLKHFRNESRLHKRQTSQLRLCRERSHKIIYLTCLFLTALPKRQLITFSDPHNCSGVSLTLIESYCCRVCKCKRQQNKNIVVWRYPRCGAAIWLEITMIMPWFYTQQPSGQDPIEWSTQQQNPAAPLESCMCFL